VGSSADRGSSPGPASKDKTKYDPDAVWREGVGPGYAVGVSESVASVVGEAAHKRYKSHKASR